MEKHFVQFFSPGTFVSEQSEFEVSTFDKVQAVEKAREIVERHGARPYGFRFVTKTRGEDDLDSHVSYYSGMHYLGGSIYSPNAASRFLILNGQIFHENDKVMPELVLEEIKLKAAVLRFRNQRFSISY